jgi:GNAT superfamily N-acetyltransferase
VERQTVMNGNNRPLAATDAPEPGTLQRIYGALATVTETQLGPANTRLLVIPIHDDAGTVAGGFWGTTQFEWLRVQCVVVPETLRGQGIGTLLMTLAEREARHRGCRGSAVDAFDCQAAGFYRKLGYQEFGVLADFPPGHEQVYFFKRF